MFAEVGANIKDANPMKARSRELLNQLLPPSWRQLKSTTRLIFAIVSNHSLSWRSMPASICSKPSGWQCTKIARPVFTFHKVNVASDCTISGHAKKPQQKGSCGFLFLNKLSDMEITRISFEQF